MNTVEKSSIKNGGRRNTKETFEFLCAVLFHLCQGLKERRNTLKLFYAAGTFTIDSVYVKTSVDCRNLCVGKVSPNVPRKGNARQTNELEFRSPITMWFGKDFPLERLRFMGNWWNGYFSFEDLLRCLRFANINDMEDRIKLHKFSAFRNIFRGSQRITKGIIVFVSMIRLLKNLKHFVIFVEFVNVFLTRLLSMV